MDGMVWFQVINKKLSLTGTGRLGHELWLPTYTIHVGTHSAKGPWNNSLNYIFPIKHVISKKFKGWPLAEWG